MRIAELVCGVVQLIHLEGVLVVLDRVGDPHVMTVGGMRSFFVRLMLNMVFGYSVNNVFILRDTN